MRCAPCRRRCPSLLCSGLSFCSTPRRCSQSCRVPCHWLGRSRGGHCHPNPRALLGAGGVAAQTTDQSLGPLSHGLRGGQGRRPLWHPDLASFGAASGFRGSSCYTPLACAHPLPSPAAPAFLVGLLAWAADPALQSPEDPSLPGTPGGADPVPHPSPQAFAGPVRRDLAAQPPQSLSPAFCACGYPRAGCSGCALRGGRLLAVDPGGWGLCQPEPPSPSWPGRGPSVRRRGPLAPSAPLRPHPRVYKSRCGRRAACARRRRAASCAGPRGTGRCRAPASVSLALRKVSGPGGGRERLEGLRAGI